MKCLGVNLAEHVQDEQAENYNNADKENQRRPNKWRGTLYS